MTLALASQLWYQQLLSSQLSYTPHVLSASSTLVRVRVAKLRVSRVSSSVNDACHRALEHWSTSV